MASVALVSLLALPEPASAQDSVTISISPAGTTSMREGIKQVVTVEVVLPQGAESSRWVTVDIDYIGLDDTSIWVSRQPRPIATDFSEGKVKRVDWNVPQGATAFQFKLQFWPLNDGIAGTGGQIKIRARTDYVVGSPGLSSNTALLNVVDNVPPDFGQNNTTRQLDENTPAFRDFGSPVSATDPDGHDLVYTLSGTDAAFFGIRPNGQLFPRRVFDFESSASSYEVDVTAADPVGATDTITVSIEIEDVNEPPDFDTDSPTLTVDENIATDTTTGKTVGSPVTATDPEGSTVSYSLGGTDAGSFAIDSNSGQITTTDAQLDRETQAEHSVTVTASDPNGNSATNDVTITLTNVNEAPAYATDSTSLSIVENTAGPIGPVTPNDVDDSSHSYDRTGADKSWFTIDGSGYIRPASGVNLDYENPRGTTYEVIVTAKDSGELSDTINVTINVDNADEELPLVPLLGSPALVGNHTGSGDALEAELTANWIAPDNAGRPPITGYDVEYRRPLSTASWSRLTAAANERTATVSSGLTFNLEYEVRVRAVNDDGAGPWLHLGKIVAATFETLTPYIFPLNYILTEATSPTSTTVEVFMNKESDRDFTLPIGIRSTDSSFEEGDISLSATELDFVSGDGGSNFVKTFTITPQPDDDTSDETLSIVFRNVPQGVEEPEEAVGVTINDPDVNSPPFFTQGSVTRSVNENTLAGVAIGDPVTAGDTASGKTGDSATLTYGLDGTDLSSFTIDATSGQISTSASAAFNYEAKSSYSVAVTVHDGADRNGGVDPSEDARINVTITVLDLDEAPGAPAAPTVTAVSSTSLTVRWSAPDNTGPPITDYNIRYRVADNGSAFTDAAHSGDSTSATLSDLFTTTRYEVQVQAVNDEGTSAWSPPGEGTTGLIPLQVAYESDSYETVENGLVAVRVQLDEQTNRQIKVPISVTPGSNTNTSDYTVNGLSNDRLTFEVGTIEKVFTVSANQDADSDDEQVNLAIDEDGLPGGVTAAAPSIATLNIHEPPTVEITSEATAPVTEAFTVTITFSEDVTGFEVGEIEVDNGTASDLNPTAGPASTYTVTITPTATGDVTVAVPAGVAEDTDGNNNQAAETFTIAAQLAGPTVEITSEATGPVIEAFSVTITFSEDVTGFEVGEIDVTNGTASDLNPTAGPATTYTVTITPTATGDVTVAVPAGVAEDTDGNNSQAADSFTIAALVAASAQALTVSFEEPTYKASEGDPDGVTITVTLSKAAAEPLTVSINVTAEEGVESDDYTVEGLDGWDATTGSGSLTFGAGEQTKNLSLNRNNLPVRDDSSGQLQQGDMGRMVFLEPNQELAKPVEP